MTLSSRMTIAMASLVLLSVLAVGELTDRNVEATVLPHAMSRVTLELRILTTELASYVGSASDDVAGVRTGASIQGLVRATLAGGIDPLDGVTETTWRQRMAARMVTELTVKPSFYKMRLISLVTGREMVRVDRRGKDGAIRIVPDDELLDKGDQDYVKVGRTMLPSQTYVSPVLLEHNRVGTNVPTPPVAALRVAAIIPAPDQTPFGMMIIDVDMRPIFRAVASGARPGSQIYIVDDRGNYLVHPDPARELGLQLGNPRPWQSDFPDLVAGFNAVEASATEMTDNTGQRTIAGVSAVRLAGGPRVAVLEIMPRSDVMAVSVAVERATLLAGSIAFLCACAFAVLLARSLTRPLVQMTSAVKAFPRDQAAAIPITAAGEIGVLAGAFARMMEEVKDKTTSLEKEVQEHRRTEAELARHADRERLFGAAVQSSNDTVITMTLEGIVTGWNPAAVRMFGWTAEEMFGRSINTIIPDDRPDEARSILERIRGGETINHHETVELSKAGRRIEVSLSVSPIKLPSGAIIGACKIARDITEAKRAKLLLEQESNERRRIAEVLHNTITSMTDAVLVADHHANILLSNPAAERLMGITPGMSLAEWSNTQEVFMADGATPLPLQQRPLVRAIRGEVFENFEIVVRRRKNSRPHVFVTQGGPIHHSPEEHSGAVVVYRDVTDAKETERQLRQAQKMEAVGQLTGGIAHDFNNIITVITGTIEILTEGVADRPELAAIAKMIDDAAGRGAKLTRHLVAFSRRQALEPREVNINELIVDAGRLLRPTLGQSIEIEAMLDDSISPTLIDPSQFTTALLNLAINARDAMPHGGKLMFETANVLLDESYANTNAQAQAGPYVMIAVSDTGTGIPASIIDNVFDPFFTTKEIGKGSGLGLSMVYGFVKQSGGHIKIYSEENHGTTVKLYFPHATGSARQVLESAASEPIDGGNETVLVVEDDLLVCNYVVARLQALGYRTLAATNAADALLLIDADAAIDLLFTDIVMPGALNGRQLAEEAMKRRPSLKVLFTSGYPKSAVLHHGRLEPGILLLVKPYHKSELARMIRAALGDEPHSAARDGSGIPTSG